MFSEGRSFGSALATPKHGLVRGSGIMLELEGRIMGFRFRRSIKLLPGVRINLSKSGVSTSVGVPGATVNISDKGTRATVGIPGTGLSYSERISDTSSTHQPAEPLRDSSGSWLLWVIAAMFVGGVVYGLLK